MEAPAGLKRYHAYTTRDGRRFVADLGMDRTDPVDPQRWVLLGKHETYWIDRRGRVTPSRLHMGKLRPAALIPLGRQPWCSHCVYGHQPTCTHAETLAAADHPEPPRRASTLAKLMRQHIRQDGCGNPEHKPDTRAGRAHLALYQLLARMPSRAIVPVALRLLQAGRPSWIDRQAARCLRNHAGLFGVMETIAFERRSRAAGTNPRRFDAVLLNLRPSARRLPLAHLRLRRRSGRSERRITTVRLECVDALHERSANAITVGAFADEYARGALILTTYVYAKSGRRVTDPREPEAWVRWDWEGPQVGRLSVVADDITYVTSPSTDLSVVRSVARGSPSNREADARRAIPLRESRKPPSSTRKGSRR